MGDKSFDGDIPQDVIDDEILHANDAEAIVTLFTFGHLVRFLSSKKRGEFPTTMQLADKKTAIASDLKTLIDAGGPVFDARQYIVWAKRVEIVARSIGTELQEGLKNGTIALPPKNQFGPKDLKRLFALPDKLSKNLSVAQQIAYCEEWYSELSSLGIELTREPNFLNPKDLTKLEASTLTAQRKEEIAREKKRVGDEAIKHSSGGWNYLGDNKRKKAKVPVGGGTNLLASPGVPVQVACTTTPPTTTIGGGDIASLRETASTIVASLQHLAQSQQRGLLLFL